MEHKATEEEEEVSVYLPLPACVSCRRPMGAAATLAIGSVGDAGNLLRPLWFSPGPAPSFPTATAVVVVVCVLLLLLRPFNSRHEIPFDSAAAAAHVDQRQCSVEWAAFQKMSLARAAKPFD